MKRKKVTLNRKVYRKGDLIKGRIVFEYPEEINSLCPVIDFIAFIEINGEFARILK